jgi:D-alanyl-D-alanine carboxypeptidase
MPNIIATARLAAATLAALLLAAPVLSAQGASMVPPPSDSVAREAIDVLQQGDAARRGGWIGRTLSVGARKSDSASSDRLLAQLHETGAPFRLVESKAVGRHRLVTLLSARAGRVVTLDLTGDRADPTRLGPLDILEAHAAVADSIVWPATRPRDDAVALAVVRRNLDRLAQGGGLSGTIYVARGDSVLLARGYGLANREDGAANAPHTRFALASMGKMFTATAVLQLVDAGKLRLDDTLARVLSAYPNRERAERITIRNLLEHSAGLGDLWSTPKRPVAGLTGQLASAAAVAYAPLLFEPGTRWSYSNEGYVVLAAVVEQLSGERFQDYLVRHVFAPAGMTETVLAAGPDDIVPFRAVGYRPPVDDPLGALPLRGNWSFLGSPGSSGAGGGYSTVGDIARFARALRTGKLIRDSLRTAMWTGRWDLPGHDGQKYGFASFVQPIGSRVAVGHGGGGTGSGMDNGFKQFTDGSYIVVALANMEPPAGGRLADAIIGYLGAPVETSAPPRAESTSDVDVTLAGSPASSPGARSAKPIAELTLVPQRTRWALDVKVGGQPFRFGLDIGGGLTIVSSAVARAARCTP